MSFLEALADAIQAPLRNAVCALNPSAFSVGVGVPPSFSLGAVFPASCGQPIAPQVTPVLGGQCPTLYNVSIGVVRPDGTVFSPIDFANVVGPIRDVGGEWTTDFFGNVRFTAVLTAPSDTEPPTPGFRKFGPFSGFTDPTRAARAYIISIARVDGLPDNCTSTGTPTPPTQPPQQVSIGPISVSFGPNTFNLGSPQVTFYAPVNIPIYGGIHIPVTVRFAPSIAFPGGVSMPIYLTLPELNINPRISFFSVDLSPEIKPLTVNVTFPQGPGGGSGGDIPTVERLLGVNVSCTVNPGARPSLITDPLTTADLYVPYLGIVRFTPPSAFSTNLSVDVPIKTLEQFVPCPWFYGAEEYDILPNAGVEITSAPVFADIADLVKPL